MTMNGILRKKWRDHHGMTLMEVLTVVAVLCVVAAVVIPSVVSVFRTLEFQKRNNYARSIFLAAQAELLEMRSSGELKKLEGVTTEAKKQRDAVTPPSGYVYTTSGDEPYFQWLLPAGSIDETIRDDQIIMEYSPRTGNVYAVFYYEGKENIFTEYALGHLSREKVQRKQRNLGYYDGSDLAAQELGVYYVEADIHFENGQEGMVTVVVPAQATVSGSNINFMENYDAYKKGLEVTLTITGERGGTFTKIIKPYGSIENCTVGGGEGGVNAVYVCFPLDSLADQGSFASIPENDKTPEGKPGARTLTEISAGDYVIKPGDNVTITAEVSFRPGMDDPMVIIESAAIAGVNPMFESLTPGSSGYVLAVSNGRNLQNLNAIAPEIARNVEAVVFFPDLAGKEGAQDRTKIIDWKDTVEYYNKRYNGNPYQNAASEAPARSLPYFVPIHNEYLFGTAVFEHENARPILTESDHRARNADIVGNGVKIYNLDINTEQYPTNKKFYAGTDTAAEHKFTGLFGYANTRIDGVYVVNSMIRGDTSEENITACGALIGAAGEDSYLSNCGAYVDTEAPDYVPANLNMAGFDGGAGQYGVSGSGAVGGLVGYAEFTQAGPNVTACFGAVPVYGVMTRGNGYIEGTGGLVGNTQMGSFLNCYASGSVTAEGCTVTGGIAENTAGITAYGPNTTGVGGLVGTSHGTVYANCFAAGNVKGTDSSTGAFAGVLCYDSGLGAQRTKLTSCYGAGSVYHGGFGENFCGVAAILNPNRMPASLDAKNCYYLSRYLEEESQGKGDAVARPMTYEGLESTATSGFGNWVRATEETTHSYGPGGGEEVYPFLLPSGAVRYYGLLPARAVDVTMAYYESYPQSETYGYYLGENAFSTLKTEIVGDAGYLILSSSEDITVRIGREGIVGTVCELEKEPGTVVIGKDAYYAFKLPAERLREAAGEAFYAKVEAEAQWQDTDGAAREKTWIMYVNPDVAMSQKEASERPPVPEALYIRSARQLAALADERMKPYLRLHYIQQTDIDFSITGTEHRSIAGFTGIYDGSGKTIRGAARSLFASNGGVVQNVHLVTQPGATGNLAQSNSGTIRDCSLTGSGTVRGAGFVTSNGGTIENCIVQAAVVAEGTAPAGILVGEMLGGTIMGCQVSGTLDGRQGGSEAAVGGVVGLVRSGNIADVTSHAVVLGQAGTKTGIFAGAAEGGVFTDCHAAGENTCLPFVGYAAQVRTEPVHRSATHYALAARQEGVVRREDADAWFLTWEAESRGKPTYAATFDDCTFVQNGTELNAIGRTYYYNLEGVGGYKAVALAADEHLPDSGDYLLITADGEILTFTEGGTVALMPFTEQMPLTDSVIWSPKENHWTLGKTPKVQMERKESGTLIQSATEYALTAVVTPRKAEGESLAVTVSYTVTAKTTQTVTKGDEAPVVSTAATTAAAGTMECFLYAVTENTDFHVTCVDTHDGLMMPVEKGDAP